MNPPDEADSQQEAMAGMIAALRARVDQLPDSMEKSETQFKLVMFETMNSLIANVRRLDEEVKTLRARLGG